jgi:hypothetical protein
MNTKTRDRLAAPLMLVYWLMLVAGLAFYTAIRRGDGWSPTPLWIGVLVGTALGHVLALRNYRLWFVTGLLFALLCWALPLIRGVLAKPELWKAFVPAVLCAYWSLGHRSSLVAFWFPAVIWMLSILDRVDGQTAPDGAGIVLLGGLALLFIMFLRVSESRRVGLWRTVAATPLAIPKPSAVLKEPPGRHFARAAWGLGVSAITFSLTAWVAPHLWDIESSDGDRVAVAGSESFDGRPCCEVVAEAETSRSRVKDYFDLGRGRDRVGMPMHERVDCRACDGRARTIPGRLLPGDVYGEYEAPRVAVQTADPWMRPQVPRYNQIPEVSGESQEFGGTAYPQIGSDPAVGPTPSIPGRNASPAPFRAQTAPPSIPEQALAPPSIPEQALTPLSIPEPAITPPPVREPAITPPSIPEQALTPPPIPEPAITPPPVREPAITPPSIPEQALTPPSIPEPAITPPPAREPATASPSVPVAATPKLDAAPMRSRPHAASDLGRTLVNWLVVIVAAAALFQIVNLVLRPMRRALTLRHLRTPFWNETIDQRVSNSWQLALIGLRDAGWRASSTEAPRDFAQRTGVDGLERCATILERARHGIGIDADDLSEMSRSADEAYRSARSGMSRIARATSCIRWPLT